MLLRTASFRATAGGAFSLYNCVRPLSVLRSVSEVREWRAAHGKKTLGFVPTMGALHAGHLDLMSRAGAENDAVMASIYVNPKQFAPHEDFAKYPRPLEADLETLRGKGVQAVFLPTGEEMYPASFRTYVDPANVDNVAEGTARPGFFRGVATVVCKLFNIAQPSAAYFGQKDGMQCIVVRRLAEDLNMPLRVVICPTVREYDGLAMSSRNVYLDTTQRAAAPDVYRALQTAEAAWVRARQEGAHPSQGVSARELREGVTQRLQQQPMFALQYVSVASGETGEELKDDAVLRPPSPVMVSVAVRVGNTRLIDNVLLQ